VVFFESLFQEKKLSLSFEEQEQFSAIITKVKNFLKQEYP